MKPVCVRVCAASVFLLLAGCSGYRFLGGSKSTVVDKISPNTFTVNFCGNAYMSEREVEKYALQRAAEVTLSEGCAYFAVLDKRDDSEMCTLSSRKTPPSSASEQVRESSDYDLPQFKRPNVTLTIRCIASGEEPPEGAVDAEDYLGKNFPGLEKQ